MKKPTLLVPGLFLGVLCLTGRGRTAELPEVDVSVKREGTDYHYQVTNRSSGTISIVSLSVEAPFVVKGVPDGWSVQTDSCSTVSWMSADTQALYRHDIGPGITLGGFIISSTATASTPGKFVVQQWADETQGKSIEGSVLVPGSSGGNCAQD